MSKIRLPTPCACRHVCLVFHHHTLGPHNGFHLLLWFDTRTVDLPEEINAKRRGSGPELAEGGERERERERFLKIYEELQKKPP